MKGGDNMFNLFGNNFNMQQQQQQYNQIPKSYTKSAIIAAVSEYCYNQTGVAVTKTEKVEECPTSIRHACLNGGIRFLPQYYLTLPSVNGNITVYFYFCTLCGKLFIFNDF